jgi:hypothetical protein
MQQAEITNLRLCIDVRTKEWAEIDAAIQKINEIFQDIGPTDLGAMISFTEDSKVHYTDF